MNFSKGKIMKDNIKKHEACSLLKIKAHTLRNLTNSNKIIEVNKKEVSLASVLEYQKELSQRRSMATTEWLNVGGTY